MKMNENSFVGDYKLYGGLAQLARAPALQAGGQRFESVILHCGFVMERTKVSDNPITRDEETKRE